MIQTEEQPKKKRRNMQPEHKLQSELVKEFSKKYPERRGELFATFQETKSQGQGGVMLSLGLVSGVSDLLLINNGELTGIEVKCPQAKHNTQHIIRQAQWLLKVPKIGYFCDSIEIFFEIVKGGKGIDPRKVLNYCNSCGKNTITWDSKLFFQYLCKMEQLKLIPKRINSGLSDGERMFILASAVLPCDNLLLYKTFVEPRWAGTEKKLRNEIKEFLNSRDAEHYREDLEADARGENKVVVRRAVISAEDLELKVQDATMELGALLCDKVLDTKDPESLKYITTFLSNYAKEIGKAEVTPPLRILSEQCSSCRYRLFVEENYEDSCKDCKYKNGQADAKNEA